MRRWLLVALVAVLAVGELLDATVHREAAGGETLGQQRRDLVAGTDAAVDRTVPTLVGTADEWDGRYSLYLAIRGHAPGAAVLVDELLAECAVSEVFLRALGAAAAVSVVLGDAVPAAVDLGAPLQQGHYEHRPWALYAGPEEIGELLVMEEQWTVRVVATTLLGRDPPAESPTPAATATTARDANTPPSLLWTVTAETAILLALLLLGGLLLPQCWLDRTMRIALALPVGLAAHASVGLLRLPGLWALAATVAAVLAVALMLRGRGTPVGWARADLPRLGLATLAVAGTVVWARWTTFLIPTSDSRDYWAGGAVLADGNLSVGLLDVKRGLSLQALHTLGFAADIEGLQALGAVLLLATMALVVAAAGRSGDAGGPIVMGLLALSLVLSP